MILIAFGANLPSAHGAPEVTLVKARQALEARGVAVRAFSRIWRTPPVPVSDQPWYSNAAALVETRLLPMDLLFLLKQIERDFGRVDTVPDAPRVLDLDLLTYGDVTTDNPACMLPHPRMQMRGFVLYPLNEVVPEGWRHPVLGQSAAAMIAALPADQRLAPAQAEAA